MSGLKQLIHDEAGDPDKAVEYYARFVELWRGADPELRGEAENPEAVMANEDSKQILEFFFFLPLVSQTLIFMTLVKRKKESVGKSSKGPDEGAAHKVTRAAATVNSTRRGCEVIFLRPPFII